MKTPLPLHHDNLRREHRLFACLLFMALLNTHWATAQEAPVLEWAVAMYGSGMATGRDIALDKNGYIYSTGDFWNTVDFDPGPNKYELSSAGGYDIFVSKVDNDGNLVWARRMGNSGYNFGYGVTADAQGNVYSTGWFEGTVDFDPGSGTFNLTANNGSGYYDVYVQKLDPDGNFLWAKSMGSGNSDDGYKIAADDAGNVYIGGTYAYNVDFDPGPGVYTLTAGDYSAAFIVKLDTNGNLVWAKGIDAQYSQEIYGLAIDASGNVAATGYFYASTVDFDPGPGVYTLTSADEGSFVMELDKDGNFKWAHVISGPYGDFGRGVATDATGNVYATGIFNGTTDFDPGPGTLNLTSTAAADAYIVKYDAAGNLAWAVSLNSNATQNDNGAALTVDKNGNVYATGNFSGTLDFDPGPGEFKLTGKGAADIYVVKLDKDGQFIWAFNEGAGAYDNGLGIKVDAQDKIYVTGFFEGTCDFDPSPCVYNLSTTSGITPGVFIQKLRPGTPLPTPTIASFNPISGPIGTEVVITGTNYSTVPAQNDVKFYNNNTATVTASTATTITTNVPAGATTGKISVTAYCVTVTSAANFTVTAAGTPTITSFSPLSGPVGTIVTIAGTNFSPTAANNTVKFNGLNAVVSTSTATSITTTVPANATTGKITVTVAGKTATSATSCTVTASNTITIDSQPVATEVCVGETGVLSTAASGTTNLKYRWQYASSPNVGFTDLNDDNHYNNVATTQLSVNTAGNFGAGLYRCKIDGHLAATAYSNAVILAVNTVPTAPEVQGDSSCPPAILTLTATGGSDGQYRWYTAATGGQSLEVVNGTLTTPSLTQSKTYYVSISNGSCESARAAVTAAIENCDPPVITPESVSTPVGGTVTLDLKPLITTDDLDLSSLRILSMPSSGAQASINSQGLLVINYAGRNFAGRESITIEACDKNGRCSQQDLSIEVVADVLVYNAVSPGGRNPFLRLEYIELLEDTRKNLVTVYNRWGDEVFSMADYDNANRVFSGTSNKGEQLPPGTYYYKVIFTSGRNAMTGFLELRY